MDGLLLHAVVGGRGPALLLLCGWPQTWYAWRFLMPALARDFTVVAVDPRGVGLSDKPEGGYDSGIVARDLIGLMEALGHQRFAMVGHDVGMLTGYAMAADYPERIERFACSEGIIPGVAPSPPLLGDRRLNDLLWHFAFNRRLGSHRRVAGFCCEGVEVVHEAVEHAAELFVFGGGEAGQSFGVDA